MAVLGLAGLLALQFGRSPQTEQDVGLGRSAPSAQEGTVSDSGERVARTNTSMSFTRPCWSSSTFIRLIKHWRHGWHRR